MQMTGRCTMSPCIQISSMVAPRARGKPDKSAKSGFGDDYDRIWEAKVRRQMYQAVLL